MGYDFDLKIAPEYFKAQFIGTKNFEIREDDHPKKFEVGDIVRLREFDGNDYTGRSVIRIITYVTDYAQHYGYVVFGTKPYNEG